MKRSLLTIVVYPILWASVVYFTYLWMYRTQGWPWSTELIKAGFPFALGPALASLVAFSLPIRFRSSDSSIKTFSRLFLLLYCGSIIITAIMFGVDFKLYFSTWHAPTFSIQWAFQTFFTTLAAVFLFLSTALKIFVGPPLLVALVFCFAAARAHSAPPMVR